MLIERKYSQIAKWFHYYKAKITHWTKIQHSGYLWEVWVEEMQGGASGVMFFVLICYLL
jgi:hypothetical protein